MNRAKLKNVRNDINRSLESIGKKYNLKLHTVGTASYTNNSFRVKIEGEELNKEGESKKVLEDFIRGCGILGLQPSDFGAKFSLKGESYTITGLKLSRPKYPILAKSENGNVYKFPADVVKGLLDKGRNAELPS